MTSRRTGEARQRWSRRNVVLVVFTVFFLIWSGAFIYRSSFVALDGRRYFSLFDDAMISMRYAWNLSHGNGLVWNPGQRVEGYSNLLMVLVMAIPNLIFEKRLAALTVQMLGVLLMIGNAWLAMQIARFVGNHRTRKSNDLLVILAFGGTLAYYPLAFWSLMGMETGLLTLLCLLAVLACVHYSRTMRATYMIVAAIAFGLAFLARPDSIVFSLVVVGFTITGQPLGNRHLRPAAIRAIVLLGGVLLFALGQLLFRLVYYQEVLPNTYVLKLSGMPLGLRLWDGLRFLMPFIASIIPTLFLVAAGTIASPGRWKLMFVSAAAALIVYQVWTGGDAWPYWRILAPSFPLVFIVLVHGSSHLSIGDEGKPARPNLIRATFVFFGLFLIVWPLATTNPRLTPGIGPADMLLIGLGAGAVLAGCLLPRQVFVAPPHPSAQLHTVVLSALALISLNLAFLPEIAFRVRPYTVAENIEMVNRALAISEVTTSNAIVGVFYAGAIPYYTGLPAIDFLGRSDEYVARLAPDLTGSTGWYGMRSVPGHNKYDLFYSIVRLAPTYVQNVRWGRQDLTVWAETAYVTVVHRGVLLRLRRNDPNVLWEKIVP